MRGHSCFCFCYGYSCRDHVRPRRPSADSWAVAGGQRHSVAGLAGRLPCRRPMAGSASMLFGSGCTEVFGACSIYDYFTVFLRCFLFGFTALVIWLSLLTGIPDREDSADFYCLLLGAVARHVADGVGQSPADGVHRRRDGQPAQLSPWPGFLKGKRQASEAALKYVVYGGGAAGIMLYGISLLAGKFGTGYLARRRYRHVTIDPGRWLGRAALDPILILGTLFLLIGIAFKLAAVPFHFWCPDVFEGAGAEVAGFLSVASKGAALALLARFALMLGGLDPVAAHRAGRPTSAWLAMIRIPGAGAGLLRRPDGDVRQPGRLRADQPQTAAGLFDHRPRRLHDDGPGHAARATASRRVLFYLVAYLFMNLGAFAVVAFLRNQTGTEDLDDFRGLVRRSPLLVITLACLPAQPAGHPAAGRVRGQVPDLQRAVQRRPELLPRRRDWADGNPLRLAGHRRFEHGGERVLLSEGHEGDDSRPPGGGSRGR